VRDRAIRVRCEHGVSRTSAWHASRNGRHIMHILWTLLIGLVIGALAKLVMPGKDPGGVIITILLGVAGSFMADMVGRSLGWYGPGEGAGFIASILGAVILLGAYRALRRPHAGVTP
jgi:uncharacterized membrane protein YeaQ/YmgE (transglycosylase-associated protein family)